MQQIIWGKPCKGLGIVDYRMSDYSFNPVWVVLCRSSTRTGLFGVQYGF